MGKSILKTTGLAALCLSLTDCAGYRFRPFQMMFPEGPVRHTVSGIVTDKEWSGSYSNPCFGSYALQLKNSHDQYDSINLSDSLRIRHLQSFDRCKGRGAAELGDVLVGDYVVVKFEMAYYREKDGLTDLYNIDSIKLKK